MGGIFGVLTVIFVLCKLFGVIGWSWWLVLLPLYGPFLVFFLFFGGLAAFLVGVGALLSRLK